MIIKKITKVVSFIVETNEQQYNIYTRHGADVWYLRMGESDEPVYNCEEIETAYQAYRRRSYCR